MKFSENAWCLIDMTLQIPALIWRFADAFSYFWHYRGSTIIGVFIMIVIELKKFWNWVILFVDHEMLFDLIQVVGI